MINSMDGRDISAKLKARRQELGLSLHQVARRANTSAATLSRYENGWERFELYTLRKLATVLGCRLHVDLEPMEASAPKAAKRDGFRDIKRLFWDRELSRRDLEDYPLWVLQRVLEYGSLEDVRFLTGLMGRRRFLESVSAVSFHARKAESFWHQILEREGIPCTRRSSRREARPSWPG
jgi:transcriptional regulator with XRE-family HTH domain